MPRDESTYGFNKTDATALVHLIGNGDVEHPEGYPSGGGGSTSLFKVTMKAPWSSGVANCDIYSIDGVTFTDTTIDANVYDGLSIFASLTTGDHLLAILQAGKYYAIQAPCP